jgi:hypothetical protein
MLVFLTWSGDRSKAVATALRDCLRLICNSFQPWMSERDIAKGAPWFPEILDTLGKCGAGIVCITPENQDERWLLFESGAVVKSVPERRLAIPYLYGLKPSDLRPPLKEIQAAKNAQDENENWQVVQSLYGALPVAEKTINETELRTAFEMVWAGKLKPLLDSIPPPAAPSSAAAVPDPNVELLALVRELVERDRERARVEGRTGSLAGRGRLPSLRLRGALSDFVSVDEMLANLSDDEQKALFRGVVAQGATAGASVAARPGRAVSTSDPSGAGGMLSGPLSPDDQEFVSEHIAEGRAFRKYGALDKAQDQFEAVLGRFPDNIEAARELVEVLKEKGDSAAAERVLRVMAEVHRLKGEADKVASATAEADALAGPSPAKG